MANLKISIIVPVYNEEKMIQECILALEQLDYDKYDYEILVIDDGSIDNTLGELKEMENDFKLNGGDIKIINLEYNKGRVYAREEGARQAKYDNLFFIDSRCVAEKDILKKINEINYQPIIGNPIIDYSRSIYDRFTWLRGKKMYWPYWDKGFPSVYINKDNFDKIGKGTNVFFCDKELFSSSQLLNKSKNVSDDVKLFWNIVQKKNILRHPEIKVRYCSRNSLSEEIFHTFNRGPKFVDYYFNIKKTRFWIFIFFPLAISLLLLTLIFTNFTYFLLGLLILFLIFAVFSVWLAKNIKDFFICLFLLPIFGLSFELGILKGLILKIFKRY